MFTPLIHDSVPHFPQEDSKLRATELQVRRGGNCPNTLEVLVQLLASTGTGAALQPHLVSCLPDARSAANRNILSSFGSNAAVAIADFSHCLYRSGCDAPASSYIIRSSETGSRTIVNYNDLPEMTTDEFASIVDSIAREHGEDEFWWHFEVRLSVYPYACPSVYPSLCCGCHDPLA